MRAMGAGEERAGGRSRERGSGEKRGDPVPLDGRLLGKRGKRAWEKNALHGASAWRGGGRREEPNTALSTHLRVFPSHIYRLQYYPRFLFHAIPYSTTACMKREVCGRRKKWKGDPGTTIAGKRVGEGEAGCG